MVYVKDFEDFEIAASQMYMEKPQSCRYTMKYIHSKGCLLLKVTDNVKCLQYKAEHVPDLKKVEKFTSNLMGHMASKE
ncbi:signal recognition particle 9 kDa protein [Condylostylus longicornis]|uniref:signal recognition particle 9 kDa protein n=1 Tax=Condylostylus longicornis TaxID=2530218 RepID=UPI00244DDB8C|nr:signal recognition particle 9 kDa protein [Condylostylus longicornis]